MNRNYLAEILSFNDLLLTKRLSTGQIALWYGLMYINNKCKWEEWFTAPNRSLELCTGLSRQGIVKARNALKQIGLIDFKTSKGKESLYRLNTPSNSSQPCIQENSCEEPTPSNSVQGSVQGSVQDSVQGSCSCQAKL